MGKMKAKQINIQRQEKNQQQKAVIINFLNRIWSIKTMLLGLVNQHRKQH